MASPKRSQAQRAADLTIIEDLALKGKTETEIAEELASMRPYTLSRQQVGYDLRKLAKMWEAEAIAELDAHKSKILAEVRHLQREYWDAWARSCEDAETQRIEGAPPRGDSDKPTAAKLVTTRKGQAGDPRFLQGVQWCIERRCKILGVDAPQRAEFGPIRVILDGNVTPDEF